MTLFKHTQTFGLFCLFSLVPLFAEANSERTSKLFDFGLLAGVILFFVGAFFIMEKLDSNKKKK